MDRVDARFKSFKEKVKKLGYMKGEAKKVAKVMEKVADFGMAALKQHFFFQRGNQVGTPQWTAPEVLKGGTAVRSDSDVRTL